MTGPIEKASRETGKMSVTKKNAVIFLVALLAGCATTPSPRVVTSTTDFFIPDFQKSGSILVVAADAEINGSLEFAHYKSKFEAKFSEHGYQIVHDPEDAEYIALVAYGIDNGRTSIVSTPIYGQTGGGVTYSSGTVYGAGRSTTYSGRSYTMPSYGVVGSSARSQTRYARAIALDIVWAQSLIDGRPDKVYEGRARSLGTCGIFVEVFDEILEAMFQGFPGSNGGSRKLEVPPNANC
jgi:hypothetical protein